VHAKWFCKISSFIYKLKKYIYVGYIYFQANETFAGLRMFYFPRMHEKLGARTGYDDEKVWEESGRLS